MTAARPAAVRLCKSAVGGGSVGATAVIVVAVVLFFRNLIEARFLLSF